MFKTNGQPDINKIFIFAKDTYQGKHQLLINNKESIGLFKYLNHSKAFTEYSNCMDDIYENTEEYNRNKKRKIMIVFEDVILISLFSE